MKTIGVVAGSFDPITNGHVWMIQQAARLVDQLHVVIGQNPAKKGTFTEAQRLELVQAALKDVNFGDTAVQLHILGHGLLVHFAQSVDATHLIRGVRNAQDFTYESDIAVVNRRIAPHIQTVFVNSPPELSAVSSSVVRSLVGFKDWRKIVKEYVHPAVVNAFAVQLGEPVVHEEKWDFVCSFLPHYSMHDQDEMDAALIAVGIESLGEDETISPDGQYKVVFTSSNHERDSSMDTYSLYKKVNA
mgnify:CR=1 FL=1